MSCAIRFTKFMLILNFSFLDSKALLKMGIRGVTVSDVRGFGAKTGRELSMKRRPSLEHEMSL